MIGWIRNHHRRLHAGDHEQGGFAALELAIMTTFVVLMLLLVTAFGRVSRGRELLDHAAQAASRAGSLSYDPASAATAATQAAQQTLADGGLSCRGLDVELDTSAFHAGGQVVAHVRCTADLSGLTVSGVPGAVTLRASSTSPLGIYRQLGSR